jgi:hypothetical protein
MNQTVGDQQDADHNPYQRAHSTSDQWIPLRPCR